MSNKACAPNCGLSTSILVLASLLGSGSVLAGESPSMGTPQPTPVTAGTNWSGFYVGLHGGATKGSTGWSNPTGAALLANSPRFPSNSEQVGIIAGGTVGWNFQSGAWVFGVEGDIDVADNTSNGVCGGVYGVGGYHWYCRTKTNLLGSVAGRVGYTVGPILWFAKVGPAFSHYETTLGYWNPALPHVTQSQASTGLALGLGVEYEIAPKWSAKVEVDHYTFGKNKMYAADAWGTHYGTSVRKSENLVKFGFNYRFADEPSEIPVASEPSISNWSGEFGTRMGWTAGQFAKNLYSPTTVNQLNSRLTWSGQDGMNLEGFGKLNHVSGIVISALIGGVQLNSSSMHDEDFFPAVAKYSNTVSKTKTGANFYATLDFGYKVLSGDSWKLITFGGFNYYEDRLVAYGCNQLASSTICTGGSIVGGQMVLSQSEKWSSMRLGLSGEFNITDRISLSGQAAWLPFSKLDAVDNHWLRSDINPMKESAIGHQGYQLEAIAAFKLTEKVSVGVGVRHWSFSGSGHTKFPTAATKSPMTFSSNRSSIFAQLSYAFGK